MTGLLGAVLSVFAVVAVVWSLRRLAGGEPALPFNGMPGFWRIRDIAGGKQWMPVIGYIVLLLSVAVLFPGVRKWFLEDVTFLVVSQTIILTIVLLISFSEGWWRWAVATLLVAVLAVSTTQRIEETNEEKRKVAAAAAAVETPAQPKQREVRHEVPSRQYGTWRLVVDQNWWTKEFCPLGGSYIGVERVDHSVGLNLRVKRPNGRQDLQNHPPGDKHLDIGAFKCLEIRGEKITEVKITISRSPPS